MSIMTGDARAEVSLTQVFAVMLLQRHGEEGGLLVNGFQNPFFVRDQKNIVRDVCMHWDGNGKGWNVDAYSAKYLRGIYV